MTPFTNENVNAYLASIGNDINQLQTFVNDMQTNFSTAISSRWTLSTWQTNRIAFLASAYANEISALLGTIQNVLNTRYDYSAYPLQAVVTGIYDPPASTAPDQAANCTSIQHSEHKFDPGCTEPPPCRKIQDIEISFPF